MTYLIQNEQGFGTHFFLLVIDTNGLLHFKTVLLYLRQVLPDYADRVGQHFVPIPIH